MLTCYAKMALPAVDEVSMVLVLSSVAQLATSESGRWLHHSFVTNSSGRVRLNARVGTALIDMYVLQVREPGGRHRRVP